MQLISTYVKPLVEFKVRCGYLRGSCPSGEIRLQRHPGTDSLAREQFQRQPRLATLAAAFSACHQGEVRAAPGGQSPLVLVLGLPTAPGGSSFQLTHHLHGFVCEISLAFAPVTQVVKL